MLDNNDRGNPHEPDPQVGTCPATGFQRASVCVPVTVVPFANTGTIVTRCCGDTAVFSTERPCSGTKNGVCHFTINQTICVEVPVNFGARAQVDDIFVDCLGSSVSSDIGEDGEEDNKE